MGPSGNGARFLRAGGDFWPILSDGIRRGSTAVARSIATLLRLDKGPPALGLACAIWMAEPKEAEAGGVDGSGGPLLP